MLGKTKSAALRVKCAHNLKQINLATGLYTNSNDDTYPCAEDPLPAGYWLWMGRGWRPLVEPYLGNKERGKNASVLLCPADRTDPNKYDATSYAYSMAFYHSPEQIDSMSSPADTYGSNTVPSVPQRTSNVSKPSQKILSGEWFGNHAKINGKDNGWWGWQGSRNYLFADGHVAYLKAKKIRPANDGFPNANLTTHGIRGVDIDAD